MWEEEIEQYASGEREESFRNLNTPPLLLREGRWSDSKVKNLYIYDLFLSIISFFALSLSLYLISVVVKLSLKQTNKR